MKYEHVKCNITTIYNTQLDNDEKNNTSNNKHLVCLSSMFEYSIVGVSLVSPSDDSVTVALFL